ncbi:Transcriptional regulatory protein SEF1 [Varanus komodoensis]|nr:Transcriptional regulatory protein SEF1 [Varanus komodoensis]
MAALSPATTSPPTAPQTPLPAAPSGAGTSVARGKKRPSSPGNGSSGKKKRLTTPSGGGGASFFQFNMAPPDKKLSEDLKKRIVALHKDGLGYKKIAKTLKLSCSTVAKTIQQFNRTGSTQNRPRHGRLKKLSARAQRHIQRLALGNRRMSAVSIAAEVEGVVGQPVSVQTIRRTLHQIGLQGCRPKRKPRLKMMHKKAHKQFAEDKQTKGMD